MEHRDFDTAPQPQGVFEREDQNRKQIEELERLPMNAVYVVDRRSGERSDVE